MRKAWFFEKDRIVCLGTDISSESGGQILTSIQQSLLDGPVICDGNNVKQGRYPLEDGSWVHHAGIGYHIIRGSNPEVTLSTQNGNWRRVYTTRGDPAEVGMDVFSISLSHGASPKGQDYAYVLYPDAQASDMPDLVKTSDMTIISNTRLAQVIALNGGECFHAVFYEPGSVEYVKGKRINTDTPCLLTVDFKEGTMFVSEPTQTHTKLTIIIDGNKTEVPLPVGALAGKSVTVSLDCTDDTL